MDSEGIGMEVSRVLLGNMDEITDVSFLKDDASKLAVASNAPHIYIFDRQSDS